MRPDKNVYQYMSQLWEIDKTVSIKNRIQLEFMSKVNDIMKEHSMKRKILAFLLGIGKNELKSLFKANTVLTIEMMAKIELALDMQIEISLTKGC